MKEKETCKSTRGDYVDKTVVTGSKLAPIKIKEDDTIEEDDANLEVVEHIRKVSIL